jgi:hypothetical protein
LPSAAILIRLCATPADVPSQPARPPLTGGLLECVEAQTAGVQLPAGDQRWPDGVLTWSATPPSAAVVRAWRERALAVFSANLSSDLTSTDYREEQPAVIRLTFNRLEALAAEAEQW